MLQNEYAFISYSTKDEAFVANLTEILRKCQISYWKAPEMLPAGSNYAREIPKAIQECAIFILVVSGSSQESIWVEKEVDVAVCLKKKIIPIKIDYTPLNDMYRFYLNNVQFIDAHVREEMSWEMVKQKLCQELNVACDTSQQSGIRSAKTIPMVTVQKEKRGAVDTRSNALRMNKIPLQCEYCGGGLRQTRLGVYTCTCCGQEHYDDFKKVRIFLEKVGRAPASVIAQNTGVSIHTIYYFLKKDYMSCDR